MKQSKSILKSYFETGDKPTQEQFENLIDSFVHQDDNTKIYITGIDNNDQGDVMVRLSNGGRIAIQNPANVITQDNKIKVVSLGNIRYNPGPIFSESISERVVREDVVEANLNDIIPGGLVPTVENILASTVNRLNPSITIEEDEVVIFEYNLVQYGETAR